MDEIDIKIVKKLLYNSRLTFRELAEFTNISVSAVHKRIKKLIDEKNINAFTARPSIIALKYLNVMIFGTSNAKSLEPIIEELGQHECIEVIITTGGKFIYFMTILRNISELQNLSSLISSKAKISDLKVGILNLPFLTQPESLTLTDYKILKILNRDARMPIVDISDRIGVSTKTIKNRLNRMINNNLAEFTIEWLPLYENCYITIFHVFLNEGTSINSVIGLITEKLGEEMTYCVDFSNIPNFLLVSTITKSASGSQRLLKSLQNENFNDVIPHVLISSNYYDTWIDQLLRTKY